MPRVLAAVFVCLGVGLTSWGGGSHHALSPTNAPPETASQTWVQRVIREAGRDFGDPHATVRHIETVQLATGTLADVIEIRGRFHFPPTCPPARRDTVPPSGFPGLHRRRHQLQCPLATRPRRRLRDVRDLSA